jgi:hypothetical protein
VAGWRGPKTAASADPLLSVAVHRRRNRNHWIRSGLPCALCGRRLVYDKTLRYIGGRQNPAYLVVGSHHLEVPRQADGVDRCRDQQLEQHSA